MTSGYILIAAILLLGGLIAALGDRIGSKVGKARLRLFNLRPRQTAVLVTVLTGTLIASSTLAILFTLSKSLRQGVFELDEILQRRREVKDELNKVTEEKKQVEEKLKEAKAEQIKAQDRLLEINSSYEASLEKLKEAEAQADSLRTDVKLLLGQRSELLATREKLNTELNQLRQKSQKQAEELNNKQAEIAFQDKILKQKESQQKALAVEIENRDRVISNLDKAIGAKDQDLRQKEGRLNQLESQLAYLKQQLDILDQYYQTYQELREKRITLVRGQVLALGTVRVVEPKAALQAIDYLLREANKNAIKAIINGTKDGGTDQRVVQITKAQVDQLAAQIKDGREYVIRVVSAGNYFQGEKEVRVFTDIAVNKEIFTEDEEIATVSLEPNQTSPEEIQKKLDLLLSASQFRARSAGVVGDVQVENGNVITITDFLAQLKNTTESIQEIQAVATEATKTAGPLKLRLQAISNDKILFSTSGK